MQSPIFARPRLDILPPGIITPAHTTAFLAYLQTTPATVEAYKTGIKNFLQWLAGQVDAQKPTRQTLIAYREYLIAEYKPATVNLYITALHLLFAWLESEGLYQDISGRIKGIKAGKTHKRDNFSAEGIREILDHTSGNDTISKRDYAILALMATTGLRGIEVIRADVEDLRHIGETLVLFIQGKGRTDKGEFVKIPAPVEKALREYLATRPRNLPGKAPLFTSLSNNSRGERMTRKSLSRIVKGRFQEAGYNRATLTAHSLRHTSATLALLAGQDITQVQQMLRHSSINTTLIYAHNLDRLKSQCETSIADAIF